MTSFEDLDELEKVYIFFSLRDINKKSSTNNLEIVLSKEVQRQEYVY